MTSLVSLSIAGSVLCLVQFLAALPWLAALDPAGFRAALRKPASWLYAVAGAVGAGILLAFFLLMVQERERLMLWGRLFASVLHAQLIVDCFIFGLAGLLFVWPRGGAIALAAFREGIRHPLFWLLFILAAAFLLISIFVPYFTFGDDFKMMKHIGFDITMLFPGLFAVILASMSISDEIEGRTAITLMSKPVSRRQFLLGKFAGILLSAFFMTGLLGWTLEWALYVKPFFEWMPDLSDPLQGQIQPSVAQMAQLVAPAGEAGHFINGMALWLTDTLTILPGLVIGFCQVMLLLAVAAALATRLPMVVTLVSCLMLFFLGNLAPVLVGWADGLQRNYKLEHQGQTSAAYDLVRFIAKLFDTVAPALDYFNLGPAIVRGDQPLPLGDYLLYVFSVIGYALLYSAGALLFGLILFEDRDLA
jgi:ABC-type transport system involved in multi-copper enzyme maturation permease subunit